MLAALETLIVLAELGTMQRTATRLRITQSAVSKRIATLEQDLGTSLVEPVGRRVRLTPRALSLCERAGPLLAELRGNLQPEARPTRRLTIGVSESVLASFGPRLLRAALLEVPGLELDINTHRSPLAVDLVRSGLDDTMRLAYQEMRTELMANDSINDLRTAAFAIAIKKISRTYVDIGIY